MFYSNDKGLSSIKITKLLEDISVIVSRNLLLGIH